MSSWRLFYVIERIGDVLNLETWSGWDGIKDGLRQLERELKIMHGDVANAEEKDEEKLQRLCREIDVIADLADDILEGLPVYKNPATKTNLIDCMITDLLQLISMFCQGKGNTDCKITTLRQSIILFKSQLHTTISAAPSLYINTGNNISHGGRQETGSVTVNNYNYPNSQPVVSRGATRQSYGHTPNRDFVGFQSEVKTLLDHLIKNTETRVVGIVGMGGCGKTTLANQLYHHAAVNQHFTLRVWLCISQSWNTRDILLEILMETQDAAMIQEIIKHNNIRLFVKEVYKKLSNERYLVILDDIWTVRVWKDICPAFPPTEGSKVLVTSRNEDLPKDLDPYAFFVLKLKELNSEESYELFFKKTFNGEEPPRVLEELGKEMVNKCKGLPLAIIALAGTLCREKTPNHWRGICDTFRERIMEAKDSTTYGVVKEVLALSYYDLPYHLKPYFLYLSIFPEYFRIKVKAWMMLWIAECPISHDLLSEEKKEKIITENLEELAQRFLIQDVKRNYMGQVNAFRVHDLIREMCVEKAKGKGFLNESNRFVQISIVQQMKSQLEYDLNMAPFGGENCTNRLLDLNKFKFLRVLLLGGCTFSGLDWPQAPMKNLIHLRYLQLRFTKYRLPQSIGIFENLSTLDLAGYDGFIPKDLGKLKRLKNLYLTEIELQEECEGALKLNELRELRTLRISAGNWMLSEMATLSPTLRHLWIHDIETQEQLEAVFCCPSLTLGYLQILKLQWHYLVELRNMEAFKQCDKLHKLLLEGRIEECLNRTTLVVPPNLTKLELQETEYEETDLMALLGNCLPRLKALILREYAYLGTKLTCKVGSFPELEQLVFTELPILEEWDVERGAMPCLKDLTFICCKSLHKFPEDWRFVSNIQRVKYDGMSGSFIKSLRLWSAEPRNLNVLLDEGNALAPSLDELPKGWPEKLKYAGHEHDLVIADRDCYYCDECNRAGYDWSFRCEECDYDFCLGCAMKTLEKIHEFEEELGPDTCQSYFVDVG